MMSGNHGILEGGAGEEVLVEYVLEEEIVEEEEEDDIIMQEEELPPDEEEEELPDEEVGHDDESNQEVVIFKTEGMEADSVVTYSIPISTAGEYEEAVEYSGEELGKDTYNVLQHPYLTYQIIDGYLVPTNTITHSQKSIGTNLPSRSLSGIIPCPIKPAALTPEALRKKSQKEPDKLLIIYHCSFCDSAFEDFRSIKIHESEHIAVGDPVLLNSNPQTNYFGSKLIPSSDSKFNCPYCRVGFSMSADLGRHVRQKHKNQARGRKKSRRRSLKKPKEEAKSSIEETTGTEHYEGYTAADADRRDDTGEKDEAFMSVNSDGDTNFTYETIGPLSDD